MVKLNGDVTPDDTDTCDGTISHVTMANAYLGFGLVMVMMIVAITVMKKQITVAIILV